MRCALAAAIVAALSVGCGEPRLLTGSMSGACDRCHGLPPTNDHPADDRCESCHIGFTSSSVDPMKHADGAVSLTCYSCHGDATRSSMDPLMLAVPPRGTRGETMPSERGVGAHQKHVAPGTSALTSRSMACTECHVIPTQMLHSNGQGDVTFDTFPSFAPTAPVWTDGRCASTYCHGGFAGGNVATPLWTGSAPCGSCHGLPPNLGHGTRVLHELEPPTSFTICGECHYGYTPTSVNPTTHVNGKLEVRCNDAICHSFNIR